MAEQDHKLFFTKVSPKAVQGIRRVYAGVAKDISAVMGADGKATVVVVLEKAREKSAA